MCGEARNIADIWAHQLVQEGNYAALLDQVDHADYKLTDGEKERKRFARQALLEAGEKGVEAIESRLMSPGDHAYHAFAEILIKSNSNCAVPPLLSRFGHMGGGNSCLTNDIVEFFARIGAVGAAEGLNAFLYDRSYYTRYSASYGLGLLGVPESTEALLTALDTYTTSIHDGLSAAKTPFSAIVLASFDERRRSAARNIDRMSETDILRILREFCSALGNDDERVIEKLQLTVREVGEALYRRGKEGEMRRVLSQLSAIPQYRRIEVIWSGIGNWQG